MWQEKNKQLYKKFEFKDFKEAFDFMQAVAAVAEAQNHHPKWQNQWNKVEIWLSTHSEGKVTSKDQKLARAIDGLYKGKKEPDLGISLDEAKLYTDGGSRGNPGESACAYVICNMDDNVVEKSGFYLGIATNNQAEYKALLKALERAQALSIRKLNVFMDSELVVKQMKGQYKVKNSELITIYQQASSLARIFESINFTYIPRALNNLADGEVNRILDEHST